MEDLDCLTSAEIDKITTEQENERQSQLSDLFVVESEDNQLAKRIVEISAKRKELKDKILKAKFNIAKLTLVLKQLERQKWHVLRRDRGF
jgi:hypothetical protein